MRMIRGAGETSCAAHGNVSHFFYQHFNEYLSLISLGMECKNMLGLCALLGSAFVTSNRESGDGRYDIQLKSTQKGLPGS